jgi:hypothetical protein
MRCLSDGNTLAYGKQHALSLTESIGVEQISLSSMHKQLPAAVNDAPWTRSWLVGTGCQQPFHTWLANETLTFMDWETI